MATAEQGGATTTATSSYGGGGGGGAGGKFRKKPLQKPKTPYDRPAISLPANARNSSWLSKLVVDPASKLIRYGARRFFDSVFRKRQRLPPPPPIPPTPTQDPDSNHVLSVGLPETVTTELAGGKCSNPIRSSGRNEISDLEQLLKQKTFTRSEIDHLTDLLRSRAGEVSIKDDGERNVEAISNFEMRQQVESGPMEANRNKGDRSHGVVSNPISNSKVCGDSIASPAEFAKAYMGSTSRHSELLPPAVDNYSQVTREDTKLGRNTRIASKPFSMPLTTKTAVGFGSPENGYLTTPRSFGRSAIYNMSRSVCVKRTGINYNGYAGLSMPSTSLSNVENSERSEPKSMTLKRRSSALDDEVGYVSPIRRIRQKSNLIASGVPHTDNSIPSTSYAIVPSKSNDLEVAGRRLGSLRTLKDKSSEYKVVGVRQKSPFKLTPSMLHGQALRSMEDASSSELLLNVQDGHKFESNLMDAHDSTPQERGKIEENRPVETSVPSDTYYPVIKSDSAVSFKASLVRDGTSDYLENGLSLRQNRAAFRMSALEDYVDLDDDLPCNGLASRQSSEGRLPLEVHLTDNKFSPSEEPKVVGTTIRAELKSPSDLMLSNTHERSSAITSSELTTVPSLSVAVFDKPKEINDPHSPFSFSSKVADKFPPLMPVSNSRTSETKPESSTSLLNVPPATSSPVKVAEPEKGGHLKPLAAEDTSGKSDAFPFVALNGPLVSGPPTGLSTFTSNNNSHQVSTAAPVIFTPSVSVSDFTPSGVSEMTKISGEPAFNFGASPDPSTKVSAAATTAVTNPSSGNSSMAPTNFVAFETPNSGNVTSGLSSSTSDPSSNNSQGTLFSSSSKSFVSAVSQGSSAQSISVAPPPSSNSNIGTSFVSSLSQVSSPVVSFGFSSSASSSDAGAVVSSSGSASSLFGVNPSAVSVGSAGGSSSLTSPSVLSFGLNSSPSVSAVGSTGGATAPGFSFGASSSDSASLTTSPFSSSSSSTSAVGSSGAAPTAFGFGLSSSASASVSNAASSFSNGSAAGFSFGGSSVSASVSNAARVVSNSSSAGFSFGLSSSASAPVSNAASSFSNGSSAGFSFGASSSASASVPNAVSSFSNGSSAGFSFGASSSASASVPNAASSFSNGSSAGFSFGASSSASASVPNAASSFSNGSSAGFSFGASSSASSSSSAFNSGNSNNAASNAFGSSLQAPTSIFGSSPATGFNFGAPATSSGPTNAAPVTFNSSTAPASSSPFSFSSAPPPSVFSSPSPSLGQSVFGNPQTALFAASSPRNNFQMNAEDSMAEDPVQSSAPSMPVFGQANISPPAPSMPVFGQANVSPPPSGGFMFGLTPQQPPPQANPFQFGGQPNQGLPQNPSMFQASNSQEFNAGGSFSLGSGGGDKSGRKFVKANRSKNRKK